MYDELAHLSKHAVSVIPDSIELQNFAIHFKELSQFVKVWGCVVGAQSWDLLSVLDVWVLGAAFWGVDLNSLTL